MTKVKVVSDNDINVNLYQVPKQTLEVGGVYDLEPSLIKALRAMVTVEIFEEVETKKNLTELTNSELKSMLEEKGIEYNDKDTKAVLISHFKEVE